MKLHFLRVNVVHFLVSLCVREWIETTKRRKAAMGYYSLPLREGVD